MNYNSPKPPEILNSFEFVQAGNQIRVTDADGSVYDGQVLPPPTAANAVFASPSGRARGGSEANRSYQAARPSPASDSFNPPTNQASLYFRVTGTNKTLKRLVVFDGNVAPMPETANSQSAAGGAGPAAGEQMKQAGQTTFNLQDKSQSILSNSRIQGQAVYGEKSSMEINALPAQARK